MVNIYFFFNFWNKRLCYKSMNRKAFSLSIFTKHYVIIACTSYMGFYNSFFSKLFCAITDIIIIGKPFYSAFI